MMHFQDKYNQDEERLQRCDIHYLTPDLRIIPFCSFNVIPEWYRDKVQQKYGMPIEAWEGRTAGSSRTVSTVAPCAEAATLRAAAVPWARTAKRSTSSQSRAPMPRALYALSFHLFDSLAHTVFGFPVRRSYAEALSRDAKIAVVLYFLLPEAGIAQLFLLDPLGTQLALTAFFGTLTA